MAGVILLIAGLTILGFSCTAGFYSEKQHISRMRKRAEERYLGADSEYTGLEVYPLYNENDELKYMLIELQPQGYVYVYINKLEIPGILGMYTIYTDTADQFWYPYVSEEGAASVVEDRWGNPVTWEGRRVFLDEEGEPVKYYVSHFKAADIQNERRYLIEFPSDRSRGMMPAVKKGDNYLNLISGREVPCSSDLTDETIETDENIAFFASGGIYLW